MRYLFADAFCRVGSRAYGQLQVGAFRRAALRPLYGIVGVRLIYPLIRKLAIHETVYINDLDLRFVGVEVDFRPYELRFIRCNGGKGA